MPASHTMVLAVATAAVVLLSAPALNHAQPLRVAFEPCPGSGAGSWRLEWVALADGTVRPKHNSRCLTAWPHTGFVCTTACASASASTTGTPAATSVNWTYSYNKTDRMAGHFELQQKGQGTVPATASADAGAGSPQRHARLAGRGQQPIRCRVCHLWRFRQRNPHTHTHARDPHPATHTHTHTHTGPQPFPCLCLPCPIVCSPLLRV